MEEFKGDKRTKEYKEWKARFESSQESKPDGLGDVVESITEATGIKKLVEVFTPDGKDCGCDKRKENWNKIFAFTKPNCLNEDEYNFLVEFLPVKNPNISNDDINMLYQVHNRVFNQDVEVNKACNKCHIKIIKKLTAVLNSYS